MYKKAIQSGNLIEIFEYEREPAVVPLEKRKKPVRRLYPQERRPDAIKRCKSSFTRLVRANLDINLPPALMTLTMRDVVDISEAYKCYTLFGKRMRNSFGQAISWIAVPEFQKRGAVHFHVLVFGLSHEKIRSERRTREIADLWGYGFVDIIETDGSPRLSTYLSKYMSKAMQDYRLIGKRGYSASRNVLRPVSLNTVLQVALASEQWGLDVDNPLQQTREYATLYLGRCIYKRYVLKSL